LTEARIRTGLLGACCDVQGVETLIVTIVFAGANENVDGAGREINHRRGCNSHFARNEAALNGSLRNSSHSLVGIDEAYVPEWSGYGGRRGSCVERVDAIVPRSDKHNVVEALSWNLKTGNIERLREDITVHGKLE
jgi:hypothetical protein